MAIDSPGPRSARPESRWTRPAPATPAQQLAGELIDEDLRASAAQPQPDRSGALARLREWLRRRFSSGGTAPAGNRTEQANPQGRQGDSSPHSPDRYAPRGADSADRTRLTKQPPPGRGNGASGAGKSAREQVAGFSVPELQQVLHAALERISQDPRLQQAYKDGRLPIVEDLLRRTEPSRRDASSQTNPASGTTQQRPVDGPSTDTQPTEGNRTDHDRTGTQSQDAPGRQSEATSSRLETPFSTAEFSGEAQQSPTMGDFVTTAHPAAPSDRPSATVNFAETTAHPAAPPSDHRQATASQNPSSRPTAGTDVNPAPSNPVSDMRALTFNFNVNVTQEAPRSNSGSATRPAVTQTQSATTRSRAGR